MTHRAAARSATALVLLATLAACGSPKIVKSLCREDTDCGDGLLCEDFRCVDSKTKTCDVVTDGNPILQPSPYTVAMGDLDVASSTQIVDLHNIGNCTLTLFEAGLTGPDAGVGFDCGDFCTRSFPIEIFPNRSLPVTVTFNAKKVGPADDELKILSDDHEFPEMRVPLHANFLGTPSLVAAPNPVDFGFVPVGRQVVKHLTISNKGTGVATVTVNSITLSPVDSMDFGLDLGDVTPPFTLAPLSADNTALKTVNVKFNPRSMGTPDGGQLSASVVISTNKGDVTVPLTGNSKTPPVLMVSPLMIDLGNVPYGATNVLPLTIENSGGAPLKISYMWGGTALNTDLSAAPAVLPDVQGGNFTELQVAYTNSAGQGAVTGLLVLSSNDPSKPSVTVPVHAYGAAAAGPEVVKLEMAFDNTQDGTFTKDLRNVDLHLEHPFGLVCDKQHATQMWGMYGNANWIAFPPREEPERIILAGATIDAVYKVQVSYLEDCKSVPTELLAGLLGISTDVLFDYLSGGTVPLDPNMVAMLIANICLSHGSSNVTVTAYVNGQQIGEKTVGLGHKGDSTYAMDLVRDGGHFEVR